jgi:hypothetical protein
MKRLLVRPNRRWEDNIKVNVKDTWIHFAEDNNKWWVLVNMDERLGSIRGGELLTI